MANGKFRLLETFRAAFAGTVYVHRNSTIGNRIARELYEDLLAHSISPALSMHVRQGDGVVNRGGKIHGVEVRRNDSLFGRLPAGVVPTSRAPFAIPEGPVAEPRIGCEVKVLAKSQVKQIDRVISDLRTFASRMASLNPKCINVAVVGVNHESDYEGHEGVRTFKHRLGSEEPTIVTARLIENVRRMYDELVIFAFKATNQPPYPFTWLDVGKVELDYGAALTRVGERYEERFR
jgi:hypothetical protein